MGTVLEAMEAMYTSETPVITPQDPAAEPDRATMTRALRDLEAAQARVQRDAQKVLAETKQKLVEQLLPVVDNLDRTIRAAQGDPALIQGVRLVRSQLESVLKGYGVERIEAARGVKFDPQLHEAVSVAPVWEPAHHGLVLEQLEPGYAFGDRLLRPAKVIVGKATR
jgi:molecular chaperone GrpE (heat shock protein)